MNSTMPAFDVVVRSRRLVAIAVTLVLGACASSGGWQRDAVEVIKSPNDQREYRALLLDNGMKVLLISEADADRAAAAVDVAAGSNSDPEEFGGLAHFLEHMLFLGTQKYPASGEYQQYISARGGSYNASTAYENTNYYFEIDGAYLEPALDRFSQFFVAPLFTQDYVDRERNAVNSEYQSGLQDDGRRGQAAMKQAVNQEHPMAGFNVGSLGTLQDHGDTTLREALLAHYDRYYSANLMSAAIYGKESLEELEVLARRYFSAVPNKNRRKPGSNVPLFEPGQLPMQLNVETIRDTRTLSYAFPIPDMRQLYRERPLDYLANVLGHEGEGTLLKVLRDKGWANALSAGGGFATDDVNLFTVNVALTEQGLAHVDDITALLFQFIALVEEEGIHEWLYDELATMAELAFQYQEPGGPVGLVSGMTQRMQLFPAQDLITASYFYDKYDPALIKEVISHLRPDNMMMQLSARGLEVDKTDPWYGTRYSVRSIDAERIARWQQYPQDSALSMIKPNPFIPEDLAIKPYTGGPVPANIPNVEDKPQLVVNENGVRLWFKQDTEFLTPRANFYLYALTPLFQDSLHNSLLANFVVNLVNDQLSAFAYPANLAGAGFGIGSRTRGFTLTVGGYSDKQTELMDALLSTLTKADFQQERFDIIKNETIRSWQNTNLQTPYVRLFEEVQALIANPYWTPEERIAEVRRITLDEVKAFVPRMLSNVRLDALYHGNVTEADAREMMNLVTRYVKPSPLAPMPSFGGVVDLPEQTRIVQEMTIPHEDSAIVMYFQGDDTSMQTRAILNLLSAIIRTPFFESLRTQQQLGYVVNAGNLAVLKVNGLTLTIESPVADPLVLETRITAFLQDFTNVLASMTPRQFTELKAGYVNELRQLPQRLDALTARYWGDILLDELSSDSAFMMADAIADLTQQQVVEYFRDNIATTTSTRVVARSPGRGHLATFNASRDEPEAAIVLEAGNSNYADFKTDLPAFSYP
jgi:insulysin